MRARRLLAELRGTAPPPSGSRALAELCAREIAGDLLSPEILGEELARGARVVEIARGSGAEWREMPAADVVWIGRDVYASIPGAVARVELLEAARRAARRAVVVHVPVGDEGSHAGRVVVDAPRRILRALGLRVAEPGDRFGVEHGGFSHCFFDEEELRREARRAGLAIVRRRAYLFVLREIDEIEERADAFGVEMVRALTEVRDAERARTRETPERALAAMRARGAEAKQRGPIGRARLQRAIGWIDALSRAVGRRPSCYRRTLLELALDAGAAREPVVFGLDVESTGHIAFKDREERSFDVTFEVR
ncbi:MAG: hypothetical protein KF819_10180 [Labilithrix sp.]|nr:hypothetical protein [Labilithrix sp.]